MTPNRRNFLKGLMGFSLLPVANKLVAPIEAAKPPEELVEPTEETVTYVPRTGGASWGGF